MTKRKFPKTVRIYVKVVSRFDKTGYMLPVGIIWEDGRTYQIDEVKQVQPAEMVSNHSGECFTVMIKGQEKLLFFERTSPLFRSQLGRWFVEVVEQKTQENEKANANNANKGWQPVYESDLDVWATG